MNQWRWTLTDPSTFDMESGQSLNLRDAMNDVSTTVECLISKLKPPSPEVLLYDK